MKMTGAVCLSVRRATCTATLFAVALILTPAHARVGESTTTKPAPSASTPAHEPTSTFTTTKLKLGASAPTQESTTKPAPSVLTPTQDLTTNTTQLELGAVAVTSVSGAFAQVVSDAPAPSGQLDSAGVANGLAPAESHAGVDDVRLRELLEELRCLVCQNQSVYDSQADLATDLRGYVLDRMRAGLSDDQIRSGLADRYGSFVLYRPPLSPSTWLLWLLPGLFLLAGLAILAAIIYRRSRQSPPPPSADADEIL